MRFQAEQQFFIHAAVGRVTQDAKDHFVKRAGGIDLAQIRGGGDAIGLGEAPNAVALHAATVVGFDDFFVRRDLLYAAHKVRHGDAHLAVAVVYLNARSDGGGAAQKLNLHGREPSARRGVVADNLVDQRFGRGDGYAVGHINGVLRHGASFFMHDFGNMARQTYLSSY